MLTCQLISVAFETKLTNIHSRKLTWKISSAQCRPFCFGLNVSTSGNGQRIACGRHRRQSNATRAHDHHRIDDGDDYAYWDVIVKPIQTWFLLKKKQQQKTHKIRLRLLWFFKTVRWSTPMTEIVSRGKQHQCLSYIVNTMTGDIPVTQGVKPSAAMVLTDFP